MRQLRLLKLWLLLGWLQVAVIVLSSILPSPPEIPDIAGGDKVAHLLAYAITMLWFGLIYSPGRRYRDVGLGLIIMGIALEFVQAATDFRSFEVLDMAADVLGVASGWLLAKTPLSLALVSLEKTLRIQSEEG